MVYRISKKISLQPGFTIVELLIVIVVIGILAALTIVAYNGVQSRAVVATMQSDLNGAATLLKLGQVDAGAFPTSLASANGGKGLPASAGTTYQYGANNGTNPQSFCLVAINGSQSSNVDQDGSILFGGKNLFQKSATFNNYGTGTDFGSPVAVYSVDAANGDYQTFTINSGGNRYWFPLMSGSRYQGTTYTISLDIKTTVASWRGYWYPSEHYVSITFPDTGGQWQRWSWTYTQSGATTSANLLFGFYGAPGGSSISFRKIKLEVGSTPSCWASEP